MTSPTTEQKAAVEAFRIEYSHPSRLKRLGVRTWKEALSVCWATGEDANFKTADGTHNGGHLRSIRNDPHLGGAWLEAYEPQPLFAHIFSARGGGHAVYFTASPSLVAHDWPAGIYANRRDAKAHVKSAGAKPHNF